VVCSNCGTENEAGRKFCKECAARLAVGCPAGGAANSADATFCGECATPLVMAAMPTATARSQASASNLGGVPEPIAERLRWLAGRD
jgi:hypothetical protein